MGSEMKLLLSLICCLSMAAAAELTGGRTVYLMPMSRGLDQFIANRLTRTHVMQVVTDPAKADTIFTDHVGEQLEQKLDDLYPPPPSPEAQQAAAKRAAAREATVKERAKQSGDSAVASALPLMSDTANKADRQGSMGVSGRVRGTLFLVDVKSRQVVWSAFERPKNSTPRELDHTAGRVVKLLKTDLNPKAK